MKLVLSSNLVLAAALMLAAACGGSAPPAATTPAPASGEPAPTADHQHAAMSPELTRYHDLLSPRWHAPQGDARRTDTCTAAGELQAAADAILATGAKPENQALVDATRALATTCQANDAAGFEPAFTRVHDAFHAAMGK